MIIQREGNPMVTSNLRGGGGVLPQLCIILNRIQLEFFFNTMIIIPVFKKGDHVDHNSYRDISLITCFCKFLTSILNWMLILWTFSKISSFVSEISWLKTDVVGRMIIKHVENRNNESVNQLKIKAIYETHAPWSNKCKIVLHTKAMAPIS